jgi:hypothetical protein
MGPGYHILPEDKRSMSHNSGVGFFFAGALDSLPSGRDRRWPKGLTDPVERKIIPNESDMTPSNGSWSCDSLSWNQEGGHVTH